MSETQKQAIDDAARAAMVAIRQLPPGPDGPYAGLGREDFVGAVASRILFERDHWKWDHEKYEKGDYPREEK